MSYIGAPLTSTNFVCDTFTATAAQTAFVLSQAPASSRSILVVIDGVVQEPDVAFTLGGSTVTLSEGLLGDEKVYVLHLGIRAAVQAPADGSVTEDSLEATFATQVRPQQGTEQATTSGTTIDWTDIPSWVKRITLMFSEVSISGTDSILVQLGTASGVETTGYVSSGGRVANGSSVTVGSSTSGFHINDTAGTFLWSGTMTLVRLGTGNTWIANYTMKGNTAQIGVGGGSKVLAGALDRLRITTSGSNTFDGGAANILYE